MLFHLEHLASSLPGARDGDASAIANAGQAARHLRSAGRIFALDEKLTKKRISRELRRLDRRLATIAVLDDLLLGLDDVQARIPPDRARGLAIMRAAWADDRDAARRRLARDAAPRRCRRWVGDLWDSLQDEPVPARGSTASMSVAHRVSSRVWDAYERAWACASLPDAGDPAALFRLRRSGENLRHTLEAFGEVLPDAEALIAAVEEFEGHAVALVEAGLSAALARECLRSLGQRLAASDRSAIDAFVASREAIAARERALGPRAWGSLFDPVFGEALGVALDGARR